MSRRLPATRPSLLALLRPAPLPIDRRERLRIVAGIALGPLLTGGLSQLSQPSHLGTPWLVAPMGANAICGWPAS